MIHQNPSLTVASSRPLARQTGFTLVELLVTMTVLLVLVLLLTSMTSQTARVWQNSRAQIDAFQSSRNAFERITSHLRQATLATYLDYYDNNGRSRTDALRASSTSTFIPVTYDRASDLQFVCGQANTLIPPPAANGARPTHAMFFQAPLGYVSSSSSPNSDFKVLNALLNGVGYYINFSDNSALRPGFITNAIPSWRYRLMELYQPSQNLGIYNPNATSQELFSGPQSWFCQAVNLAPSLAPPIVTADNIVALVVRPESAATAANSGSNTAAEIAPQYAYDTKAYLTQSDAYSQQAKNQLSPLVKVAIVAIDENSAARLATSYGTNPPALYGNSPFTDVTHYDADLANLEVVLQSYHLTYRVFTSDVGIPAAQWSQSKAP